MTAFVPKNAFVGKSKNVPKTAPVTSATPLQDALLAHAQALQDLKLAEDAIKAAVIEYGYTYGEVVNGEHMLVIWEDREVMQVSPKAFNKLCQDVGVNPEIARRRITNTEVKAVFEVRSVSEQEYNEALGL